MSAPKSSLGRFQFGLPWLFGYTFFIGLVSALGYHLGLHFLAAFVAVAGSGFLICPFVGRQLEKGD